MKFRPIQTTFHNTRHRAACLLALCCLAAPSALFGLTLQGVNGSFKDLALTDSGIVGLAVDDSIQFSSNAGIDFSVVRAATDILQSIDASGPVVITGGESGLLLRADGMTANPVQWTEVNSGGTFGTVTDIANDSAGNWLAVTDEPGDLLRSINNGEIWSLENGPSDELNAVLYDAVSTNWIAVGGDGFGNGVAHYSNTGGQSWVAATLPPGTATLHGLAVDSLGNLIAVGEGVILKSTDGGVTYSALNNAPSETLFDVVAVSNDTFVAIGSEGLVVSMEASSVGILESATGGASTSEYVLALNGSALLPGTIVVEAPTIDPNGGNFTDSVSVTLTVPTGTQVYYTTDGTEPSVESTVYAGAFIIDADTTLRAVAVDGGILSTVVSASFVVATTLDPVPALRITVLDAANFQIELSASQSGLAYQLQTSESLQSWLPLQALRAGTGGALTWSVPVDGTRRFYRVLISE